MGWGYSWVHWSGGDGAPAPLDQDQHDNGDQDQGQAAAGKGDDAPQRQAGRPQSAFFPCKW